MMSASVGSTAVSVPHCGSGTPVLRARRCEAGVLQIQCGLLIADMLKSYLLRHPANPRLPASGTRERTLGDSVFRQRQSEE